MTPLSKSSTVILVLKYVSTERNSEIGQQFTAKVFRESRKQIGHYDERYVCNEQIHVSIYMYLHTYIYIYIDYIYIYVYIYALIYTYICVRMSRFHVLRYKCIVSLY